MEASFGHDLSAVRVHDGPLAAESAAAVDATAYTVGRSIVVGADAPDVESSTGHGLLSHELAHALQQGLAAPTREPALGRPADGAETQADAIAHGTLQGGASATSASSLGGPRLQRSSIAGPYGAKEPVHEVLTLTAMREALERLKSEKRSAGTLLGGVNVSRFPDRSSKKGHDTDPRTIDVSAQQFIRGVIWPDDPRGYLFDEEKGTGNYSSGITWYNEFTPNKAGDSSALIARSHFGDLQFLHGMAPTAGESAAVTQQKVLAWTRFLTDVAEGRIAGDTKLADIPLANSLFPANREFTVKRLLGYAKATDLEVRQRAAGALLHTIQDSHAAGHADRDAKTGAIQEFHSYTEQDEHKHSEKDAWGKGKTLGERIRSTPGAEGAIQKGTEVLLMLDRGATTDDVVAYLEKEVFKLSDETRPASAGEAFKKAPGKQPPQKSSSPSDRLPRKPIEPKL